MADGWRLEGSSVLLSEGQACRLDYDIRCSPDWLTRSTTVTGWIGDREIDIAIVRLPGGEWTLNSQLQPAVQGCDDIDLNFSPSTNLLPIRRLALAVGASSKVRAAWLRFPDLTLHLLEQSYTRLEANTYRYEAGSFIAELSVDDDGQVMDYAEWSRVA